MYLFIIMFHVIHATFVYMETKQCVKNSYGIPQRRAEGKREKGGGREAENRFHTSFALLSPRFSVGIP